MVRDGGVAAVDGRISLSYIGRVEIAAVVPIEGVATRDIFVCRNGRIDNEVEYKGGVTAVDVGGWVDGLS